MINKNSVLFSGLSSDTVSELNGIDFISFVRDFNSIVEEHGHDENDETLMEKIESLWSDRINVLFNEGDDVDLLPSVGGSSLKEYEYGIELLSELLGEK